jgi:hypothetical protein
MDMDDGDPRAEIERLEARIEELTETIAKCRKFILMSKLAMGAGAILIVAIIFGAIRFDPVAMIGAIAAVIGGTVLFGSNGSTLQETTSALQAAEVQRAELIGQITLRVVGDRALTETRH